MKKQSEAQNNMMCLWDSKQLDMTTVSGAFLGVASIGPERQVQTGL